MIGESQILEIAIAAADARVSPAARRLSLELLLHHAACTGADAADFARGAAYDALGMPLMSPLSGFRTTTERN